MLHVYTGDGKGKTTAALGLSARALGAGLSVAFFQFFKGGVKSSEEKYFENEKNMLFLRFNQVSPFFDKNADEKKLAKRVKTDYKRAKNAIYSGKFSVVVLDEITYALKYGAIDEKTFLKDMAGAGASVTVVITGRDAPAALIKRADLVTEMKEIKHPFLKKAAAVKGVEF